MRASLWVGCVLLGALGIAPAAWAQVPADDSAARARLAAGEAETRALLLEHATAIRAADDPYRAEEFAPLLSMVHGKRLVLLSEPTHGTHECRLENAKLVRYLVEEAGVRTLIVELGYTEGLELDGFVRYGRGDIDIIVGQHMGILWNTVEQADMMRWLAGWNAAHPRSQDKVRISGMDVESRNEAGLDLARMTRSGGRDAALSERIRVGAEAAVAMQGPAKASASTQEKAASAAYDAALADLVQVLQQHPRDAAGSDELWRAAMSIRNGRRVVEKRMEGQDGADAAARMREAEMARAALAVMAESGAPAAIITHTYHLRPGRLFPGDKVQSVGYHLARVLGDRAFFLGEEYGMGSMRAFVPAPAGAPSSERRLHAASLDPPAPGSIAAALGERGPLLIDLRDPRDGTAWSEWLESMQATHLYPAITYEPGDAGKPNWTVPADAFDTIVYFPQVTALHPIGAPQFVP